MLDRVARLTLVLLNLFLGISAIFGALIVVPQLPRSYLSGTPFPDYTVPAIALGLVGTGALVAAGLLVVYLDYAVLLTMLVGIGIAVFEVVETLVVGLDAWLFALRLGPRPHPSSPSLEGAAAGTLLGIPIPLWLQPFYFVFGLLLIALALRLFAHRTRQSLRPRRSTAAVYSDAHPQG
jgi:hypothetical protein